jgi:hypothetical protein
MVVVVVVAAAAVEVVVAFGVPSLSRCWDTEPRWTELVGRTRVMDKAHWIEG